ncbi:hypothetical protein DESUT3_24260 [Desulfuromonas versatilis]|uniref:Pseudouridine synthase n=1 Tax=Desulfuromonas versatilis TaxID=2802975 RepID=A0ABM8HXP5_9BACT|nr:RluA family pseudouridine synthase [Desulfuromonas versatilis]BCR05357.1 hypothetical protein DESUT3_24260 [Desulfuromonas versatilis]
MNAATVQSRETLCPGPEAAGERLDLFLARSLEGVSRKAVKRALDGGQVFVDGRVVKRASHLLAGGETVRLTVERSTAAETVIEPQVVFADEHLLALCKPAGMESHPTGSLRPNALDWVCGHLDQTGGGRPILLHRLDVDTSGLLLFALDGGANLALARQFSGREVQKTYLALVTGHPPVSFSVANHLRAAARGRTLAVRSGGQPAQTDFRLLGRGATFSLVEARPRTGRTHQIRAHLAGEGFPLLGDELYGGPMLVEAGSRSLPVPRHMLHAFRLSFRHPCSAEILTLTTPPPEDFLAVLAVDPQFQEIQRSLGSAHPA